MSGNKKVNLFIAGAAKAGTTTIYECLANSPMVCMCRVKEPNFFSSAELLSEKNYYQEKIVKTEEEYHRLFSHEAQPWIGEASVSYLFHPHTAEKIFQYNPAARIIVSLRNPVHRAFSHYLMDKKLGLVKNDFAAIVNQGKQREDWKPYYRQYVEYGLYFSQLKKYTDLFPANQIMVILFEELQHSLADVMQQLAAFLNIDPAALAGNRKKFNEAEMPKGKIITRLYQNRPVRKLLKKIIPVATAATIKDRFFSTPVEKLDEEVSGRLKDFYASDIRSLEKLTGKNLSSWYE